MRARTSTVLGLVLLLAAAPVHASPTMPPPPPAMRVFVGTTALRAPTHRFLAARRTVLPYRRAVASETQAFLSRLLPLFGPDPARGAAAPVVAYVPAAALGTLPHVAVGGGEALAWSPYCPPPGRQLLDLVMARQPVPALIAGEAGLQAADLKMRTGDPFGEGALMVTDINLRARNAPGEENGIDPPALAVVGIALICIAPAPRRARASPRLQPIRRLRLHRR